MFFGSCVLASTKLITLLYFPNKDPLSLLPLSHPYSFLFFPFSLSLLKVKYPEMLIPKLGNWISVNLKKHLFISAYVVNLPVYIQFCLFTIVFPVLTIRGMLLRLYALSLYLTHVILIHFTTLIFLSHKLYIFSIIIKHDLYFPSS